MLRSIIENAEHFAIYRIQVDRSNQYFGKVVLVSPSIGELTGVEDPYCFEKWFENLHPADYTRIRLYPPSAGTSLPGRVSRTQGTHPAIEQGDGQVRFHQARGYSRRRPNLHEKLFDAACERDDGG